MKKPKLIWRVAPPPQGPYSSFDKRSWPGAFWRDGEDLIPAVQILCDASYSAFNARTARHPPLTLHFADHSQKPFKWRGLKGQVPTYHEARNKAEEVLARHPEFLPAHLK